MNYWVVQYHKDIAVEATIQPSTSRMYLLTSAPLEWGGVT